MIALLFAMGCFGERDTLDGLWEGEASCDAMDFDVQIAINETRDYVYNGQLLFRMNKEVADGDFFANLLYDFEAVQPVSAGSQEVYFYNIVWSDLGCKTILPDGTEEPGGCQANGLDTSDFEEEIGDLTMDFNGIDRLVIDDGNCQGVFYRE